MQVLGIGNVTECNRSYVFLNNEGKQDRLKATEELLRLIMETASSSYSFYGRMYEEITAEYEKRNEEVKKKYHFITDEQIKEANAKDRRLGFDLSVRKDSNNEECVRQFSRVHGFYDGARYAGDRKWEAKRLFEQSKNALGHK